VPVDPVLAILPLFLLGAHFTFFALFATVAHEIPPYCDITEQRFRNRRSIQMSYRILLVTAALLAASASVYGQGQLTGKWQTDNVPAALEAQKNAPAPTEAGGRGGRGGGAQAIVLDLQVDASGKISGTVTEIGNPPVLNIETGTVAGKTITWVTQPRGVTWNLEMTDDDTVTLTGRVFAGRGGGGRGPAPDAAPGGGGAAPAAGGAPAAGDGAPRGGGGGRGFGRGPQQPMVFHRVK
jgi:hypothetical protein